MIFTIIQLHQGALEKYPPTLPHSQPMHSPILSAFRPCSSCSQYNKKNILKETAEGEDVPHLPH